MTGMSVVSGITNEFRRQGATEVVQLSEVPQVWRHCCSACGVQILTPQTTTYQHIVRRMYVPYTVQYVCCQGCKKVIFYVDDISGDNMILEQQINQVRDMY